MRRSGDGWMVYVGMDQVGAVRVEINHVWMNYVGAVREPPLRIWVNQNANHWVV